MENSWSSASLFTEATADTLTVSEAASGEESIKGIAVWTVFRAGDYNQTFHPDGGQGRPRKKRCPLPWT